MEIVVKRKASLEDSIPSDIVIDRALFCRGLERKGVEIPGGTYQVRLTVSRRATEGQLWSPDPDHRLPLIEDVPDRSGIRIHALNFAEQSEGCLGVGEMFGYNLGSATLIDARPALIRLVAALDAAEKRNEPSTIRFDNPV